MNNLFRSNYFLCFLGGLLYAMGHPSKLASEGIFPLTIIGTFFLIKTFQDYTFEKKISFKRAIVAYLLFCLATNLLGFYWLNYTLKEFGNILPPMNYVVSLLFSFVIMPQYTIFLFLLAVYRKFRELFLTEHQYSRIKLSLLSTILLSATITMLEYLIPQQFPAHVGHTWMSIQPQLALAPVFGALIFSFMSYWTIYSILYFSYTRRVNFLFLISFLTFIALNLLLPLNPSNEENTELNIRVVQANIGNFLKVMSENGDTNAYSTIIDRYQKLTLAPYPDNAPIDLIIWPETAYPHPLIQNMMRTDEQYVPQIFKDDIKKTNAEILFGGYGINLNSESPYFEGEYNSTFLLGTDGLLKETYNKHFLIPFGETLPAGPLTKWLSQYVTNISYFAPGERFSLFTTKNHVSFVTPICYEILLSSYMRSYFNAFSQKPDLIINLTNDSWYGDTSEPWQHLFLAKWRALEFDTPIIRSTNTGITSIIFPDGSISRYLPTGDESTLDLELTIGHKKKTIFHRFGPWAIIGLWIILGLIQLLFSRIIARRERKAFL